eukprot:2901496-Amphidinium_carterae.1
MHTPHSGAHPHSEECVHLTEPSAEASVESKIQRSWASRLPTQVSLLTRTVRSGMTYVVLATMPMVVHWTCCNVVAKQGEDERVSASNAA